MNARQYGSLQIVGLVNIISRKHLTNQHTRIYCLVIPHCTGRASCPDHMTEPLMFSVFAHLPKLEWRSERKAKNIQTEKPYSILKALWDYSFSLTFRS